VFRKLGVTSRHQLAPLLTGPDPAILPGDLAGATAAGRP
jgi:hypothetical protein